MFLDMVAEQYSHDMVDEIIDASDLSTDGAYTTIGNYCHTEFLQLLTHLSQQTNTEMPVILDQVGRHLFSTFFNAQPEFFADFKNCFEFLQAYEGYLRVDIGKIHDDDEAQADIPVLQMIKDDQETLELHYISQLPSEHLTLGLIQESASYFNDNIEVNVKHNATESGTDAMILIKKLA